MNYCFCALPHVPVQAYDLVLMSLEKFVSFVNGLQYMLSRIKNTTAMNKLTFCCFILLLLLFFSSSFYTSQVEFSIQEP